MSKPHRIIVRTAVVLAIGLVNDPVSAQEPASLLLLIDANSIASGRPPGLTSNDVNDAVAAVGVRDGLPYFVRNVGQTTTVATGQDTVSGWFALTAVPATWVSTDGDTGGLSNFVFAGPGLGSPDHLSSRVTLLGDAGVVALGATDIATLQGRTVCGIVYQGTLTPHQASTDLGGPTLGLVAFRINAVGAGSEQLPGVEIEILDATQVCQGLLVLPEIAAAPAP